MSKLQNIKQKKESDSNQNKHGLNHRTSIGTGPRVVHKSDHKDKKK